MGLQVMIMNIINLSCGLSCQDNPWSLIGQSYTDLTFVIGGVRHHYHQAILAQHSSMLRDMLAMARCCKCLGAECMHESREMVITLDNVNEEVFKVVMEIVYDGCGKVPDEVDEFKSIVNMLNLDSLFVRDRKDENGNKKKDDEIKVDQAAGQVEGSEDLDTGFESQFLTNDVGEIAELRLCNMLSDTIDTFEDENFSVTVHEIHSVNTGDKIDVLIPIDKDLSLLEDDTKPVDNIICDTKTARCEEDDDLEIYDYEYEDGDEDAMASGKSDEHSSDENDKETGYEIEIEKRQDDFKNADDERTEAEISDDEEIMEITPEDLKNEEDSKHESFNIRSMILKAQNESKTEIIQKVPSSSQRNKSFTRQLLDKLDGNKLSIIVNKTEDDDEILMESYQENHLDDTLSEFTSLLQRKNSEVELDLDQSRKDLLGKSKCRTEVEKKDSSEITVYHCPFENCSYSNKRRVDFHTHIGANHYRTKIQELYPNFILKHCDTCEKTFSVTSNYYAHMAKHEQFPFMSKAEISSLGRLETVCVEEHKPTKPKEEDNSNDSYGSHLLETFTAKCLKESKESENKIVDEAFTDDDDDIIEISPPKRKSPSHTPINLKRPRFYLNKSM